jgi:hypothetical protein
MVFLEGNISSFSQMVYALPMLRTEIQGIVSDRGKRGKRRSMRDVG